MPRYFEFASKTPVLIVGFIGIVTMMLIVFPALPIGGPMLDIIPGYSYETATATLDSYGEQGRLIYAWASPTLDTLFPIIYVTFFAGVIYRFRLSDRLVWLAYFPVFAGVWDLCENAQITMMLIQYPNISESQVAIASFFTQTKSNVIGPIYQLLAVALLVWAAIQSVRNKLS